MRAPRGYRIVTPKDPRMAWAHRGCKVLIHGLGDRKWILIRDTGWVFNPSEWWTVARRAAKGRRKG